MSFDDREEGPADAARIAMTDEAVLALLRQHFTGLDAMYLCPSIPGKKEIFARSVHARHLPNDERVLALFDDTVFGSGDEGILVTSRRICWRNAGGVRSPQMIEWRHVDPDRMYADRNKLVLGTGCIELTTDEPLAVLFESVFHVLAFSARAPAKTPANSGVVLRAVAEDEMPTVRPLAASDHDG